MVSPVGVLVARDVRESHEEAVAVVARNFKAVVMATANPPDIVTDVDPAKK